MKLLFSGKKPKILLFKAKSSFIFIFAFACISLLSFDAGAQTCIQNGQLAKFIKVESFDWYSSLDVPDEPRQTAYCPNCSFEMERQIRKKSEESISPKKEEYFVYQVRVRNKSYCEIALIDWSFDFIDPVTNKVLASHRFETRIKLKAGKRKTLFAKSLLPPTPTVDANSFNFFNNRSGTESVSILSVLPKAITTAATTKFKKK